MLKRMILVVLTAATLFVMPGLVSVYASGAEACSGTLPVVYIETDKTVASKEEYVSGRMMIESDDEYSTDWMDMEIRGRGNSTWYQDKKPYKIKLGKSADLLGMGKSRHWILLANALDKSQLRNLLSYNLSGELGQYYIKTRHVEVVINGDYAGLYQLSESIRIENGRIEIYDWEDTCEKIAKALAFPLGEDEKTLAEELKTDLSWVSSGVFHGVKLSDYIVDADFDISGGYLLELDEYYDEKSKFTTKNDVPIMIKSPEYAYTDSEMMDYLQNYLQDFEDAVYSSDGYNKDGKHYSEYVDMDSFIDYWIVNQFFKSVELLYKSCFMYKDTGGKLVFGPIWDMDWSSGNHINLYNSSGTYDEWQHSESQDRELWYRQLYDDPYFMTRLTDRYFEVHDKLEACIESIDGWQSTLKSAASADRERWGSEWSFDKEVSELKSWLENRLAWMDEQLIKREPRIMSISFPRENKLKIAVSDAGGECQVDESGILPAADYYSSGASAVTVSALLESENVEKYDIYVNGVLYSSCDYAGAETEITIKTSDLIPDNGGRSVIRIIGRASNGKTIYHDNYLTLRIGEAASDEAEPVEKASSGTVNTAALAAVCFLLLTAAAITVLALKKHRKS